MHRIFLTSIVAASAVAVSGVVIAPAASAVTEPTAISATASPTSFTIQIKIASDPLFALSGAFNDPDDTIQSFQYTVYFPHDGGQFGPYNANAVKSGDTKSVTANYRASNANPAGTYEIRFKPVPKAGITYATNPVAKTTFVVKHRTRMVLLASPGSALRGQKVKFYGYFYPSYSHVKGKKLILKFKAKGKKKFSKVRTTTVSKTANFRFKYIDVKKSGKYRVIFKGTKYYVESRKTIKYSVY